MKVKTLLSYAGVAVAASVLAPLSPVDAADIKNVIIRNTSSEPVPVAGTVGLSGPAVPANPVFLDFSLFNTAGKAQAVFAPRFAASSVTVTNATADAQEVSVFDGITADAGCGGAVVGGGEPRLEFAVPVGQTVHAAYPTPLVFVSDGPSEPICIAVTMNNPGGGDLRVAVNGFTLPT